MKFKVDENLPIEVAQCLRSAGYDAMTVLEQVMGGEKDSNLYRVCQAEERILVTLDLDFSDIRTYPPCDSSGIIVLRFSRQDNRYILNHFDCIIRIIRRKASLTEASSGNKAIGNLRYFMPILEMACD